jgi:hypothetical protein
MWSTRARPSVKEWLHFLLALGFVVGGVFILPYDRDIGIVTIALFGSGWIVFAIPLFRKMRPRRPSSLQVGITGGLPIRPSRGVPAVIGVWLAGLGTLLVVFRQPYGIVMLVFGILIAMCGAYLLLALATGWLPSRYLQFDPSGITFGYRRWAYTVEWDNIAQIVAAEVHSNPLLLILLYQPDLVDVRPPGSGAQVFKHFSQNLAWRGAHITLGPSPYRMDVQLLMQALERYVTTPSARAELSRGKVSNDLIEG